MVRFNRSNVLAAIGTAGMVSLLTLTGCSSGADKATSETSPSTAASPDAMASPSTAASPDAMAASPGASPAMSGSAMSDSKTAGMKQVVASTTAAVEAGDFAKAKTEFGQLEGHWSKIEDGVKEKSSDTYNKIEDTTTAVNSALNEAQPSKDKTLAALKSLDEAIAGADK
jgi:hypothetical protein